MSVRTPIPLTPTPIALGSDDFNAIAGWPFKDSYVGRLLQDDIPQRMQFGHCRVWIYRDPDGRLVGFGTLDQCDDYRSLTAGRPHPYIPLLAVNPTIPSKGYGTSIVRHLIDEATLLICSQRGCHDALLLDVYSANHKAIDVYKACGFEQVTPEIADPQEGNATYIVMAQRVSIAKEG